MKYILYKLTMPNVGSWNGKWTGEGRLHCLIKSYKKDSDIPEKVLSKKNYYYDFGDGWGANIDCSEIKGNEKVKYKKLSMGFCGYDWMIKEIEEFGRIKSLSERRQERAMTIKGK